MTENRVAAVRAASIIRVLVVDDSAYVRKMMSQMLGRSPFVEVVGTARDGREALELAVELDPDVITCDLNMPEMDGLAFVRAQMARQPVPIIIISIATQAGEQVLEAEAFGIERQSFGNVPHRQDRRYAFEVEFASSRHPCPPQWGASAPVLVRTPAGLGKTGPDRAARAHAQPHRLAQQARPQQYLETDAPNGIEYRFPRHGRGGGGEGGVRGRAGASKRPHPRSSRE